MAILSPIIRRSISGRTLIGAIYLVLVAGSISTLYPFALMLAGSTKSGMDLRAWDVIPGFLRDDSVLYRKYVEALFNESLDAMGATYATEALTFEQISPPRSVNLQWVTLWRDFLRERALHPYADSCGHIACPISKTTPAGLRAFRRFLANEISSNLGDLNRTLGTDFPNWTAVYAQPENYLLRVRAPSDASFERCLLKFKRTLRAEDRYFLLPDLYWRQRYLPMLYTRDIAEFNRAHQTAFASYAEIPLPAKAPTNSAALRADWDRFVRHTLNPLWIRIQPSAAESYRAYLRARYHNDIALLNRLHETEYASFDQISADPPLQPRGDSLLDVSSNILSQPRGAAWSDWIAWLEGWRNPDTGEEFRAPTEALLISSVTTEFRDFLARQFQTLDNLNRYAGTTFSAWEQVLPPQQEWHYLDFLARRRALRMEFLTRNFRAVIDHIATHGRGLWNTAVYTGLSVLFALLVNPAAAYALSRFRLRANYRVLLFLLLPMAFPPMITQIPVFLMLRRFHLLNTFAALLLPTLANGYSIFLLKGFFDSLPRDLYENAQLDGAGEWTMFVHITLALSKPILAVIALQAFTQAYSNFLYALLICQDERMWTLMVWIYQLQERAGVGVVYASLIIAALPMLIILLLCQRVILRGIVIPIER